MLLCSFDPHCQLVQFLGFPVPILKSSNALVCYFMLDHRNATQWPTDCLHLYQMLNQLDLNTWGLDGITGSENGPLGKKAVGRKIPLEGQATINILKVLPFPALFSYMYMTILSNRNLLSQSTIL